MFFERKSDVLLRDPLSLKRKASETAAKKEYRLDSARIKLKSEEQLTVSLQR